MKVFSNLTSKFYYPTVVSGPQSTFRKMRYVDQWVRVEDPDMNPQSSDHLMFDPVSNRACGGLFNRRVKSGSLSFTPHKNQFKLVQKP